MSRPDFGILLLKTLAGFGIGAIFGGLGGLDE
jgi:hypothetical protein